VTSTPARDENGHWLPGYSGNRSGRPAAELTFSGIIRSLPYEDKQAVVQRMLELAKEGNVRATEWLADRAEGKPHVSMDVNDGPNELLTSALRTMWEGEGFFNGLLAAGLGEDEAERIMAERREQREQERNGSSLELES
jgi:hypothetical protein